MKKKTIIWLSVLIVIALGIGVGIYYYFFVEKSLKLTSPNGKETWEANRTYQITWKARKIGKVGIMLVKEGSKDTQWIAKEVPALDGKYDWNIFVWQEPREDYKIVIFEYLWQEGNKIDYSNDNFTILGPKFASCDNLSVEKEWPYLSSDYPNLRKVFITAQSFTGNLQGLEGADKKCQEQAESEGFQGTWKAFLGSDQALAQDRLNLEGIFVDARSSGTLPEGKTCHQLWGRNFGDFFQKFSDSLIINKEKFEDDFLQREFSNIWLGRINQESKRDCAAVFTKFPVLDPSKSYSFTTTCQNWTSDREVVSGYPPTAGQTIEFAICYNPQGKAVKAAALSGLSTGLVGSENEAETQFFSPSLGKLCNNTQKLLCVQQ